MPSPLLKAPNQPSHRAQMWIAANVGSHDRAALGSLLAEAGTQKLRLAGQVKEAFRESSSWTLLNGWLQFVETHERG